jgi:hypothetical protein
MTTKLATLAPSTFGEAVEFAGKIATTDFVPKAYKNKPAEILAAIQYGAELGLGPLGALNGLIVISGKVTLPTATMRALVEASGKMEKCTVTYQADPPLAIAVVKRVGRAEATHTFGLQDAQNAGLSSGHMYTKYPERMYRNRALGFALRDEFADVLQGIMTAEEMADVQDEAPMSAAQPTPTPAVPDDNEAYTDYQEALAEFVRKPDVNMAAFRAELQKPENATFSTRLIGEYNTCKQQAEFAKQGIPEAEQQEQFDLVMRQSSLFCLQEILNEKPAPSKKRRAKKAPSA